MNDSVEIVFSWVIIFFAFIAALAIGLFIARTDELNTFHERVNPIIEEYGGSDKVTYPDGTNKGASENTILKHMSKNSGLIRLHVDPNSIHPTNTDSSNGAAKYGHLVTYRINMKVHMPLGSRTINTSPKFQAVSKVGQD